jgi:hypothetical protein
MGYPVAYLSGNTTTYETGMFKRGTIGQNQAAALTGNYRWWNGIDVTSSQYLIYSDTFTTSASTAANATPAAWATPDLADQSLINLINTLPERIGKLPFTYLPVALQWIQSTGRYFLLKNGYENIVTNGLVHNLDAGWYLSYSGTGTTWKDLSGNYNGTLTNGPTFNNNNGGSIVFDGGDDYTNLYSLDSTNSLTIDFFFKNSSNGIKVITGMYNGGGADWWIGIWSDNKFTFSFGSPAKADLYSTNTVSDGQIRHASCVYNKSINTTLLYIDGILQSTGLTPSTVTQPGGNATIGRFGDTSNYYWPGNIYNYKIYNRALSATEVLQNFNAQKTRFGLTADTIVTSGLTLNLDAGNVISYPTTGTSWYDVSYNNCNGVLSNGPTFSSSGVSSSIVFDGIDDYGIIPYNSAWNYNNNITLEAWVMVTSNTNWYQGIFGPFSLTPAYNGFNFSVNAGTNKFAFLVGGNGGAAYYVQQNTQYSLNTWYHLVGVINNGTSRLYVNGILQNDSTSMTVAPPVGPFMLGKFYDGINDFYFGGRIANGKFYNRVLSQSEITQNYNALKGRYGL